MDTQKILTAVFLICVAVGAVGAVAFIVMDGTQGGDDCKDVSFKSDLTLGGQHYEYTVTDPQGTVSVVTYTFTKYNPSDETYDVTVSDGKKVRTDRVAFSGAYPYIQRTMDYAGCSTVAKEVLETPWGKVSCNVMEKSEKDQDIRCYVGKSSGVLFKKVTNPTAEPDKKTVEVLTDSTLFNEPKVDPSGNPDVPAVPDADKSVRDEIREGDYIKLKRSDAGASLCEDTYLVKSVDPETGLLTVANDRAGTVSTVVMTKQDFMDMIVPVMGGSSPLKDGPKTIQTSKWGDVPVDVYRVSVPAGGKTIVRDMYVDHYGVLFKWTEKGEGITDNGGASARWDRSFTLIDTSLLIGYDRPAA